MTYAEAHTERDREGVVQLATRWDSDYVLMIACSGQGGHGENFEEVPGLRHEWQGNQAYQGL